MVQRLDWIRQDSACTSGNAVCSFSMLNYLWKTGAKDCILQIDYRLHHCLFGIAVFAIFMSLQIHFWILAVAVGMFQGGIQALSRSWFAKIVPAESQASIFGLMDICGKGASFFGTGIVSIISDVTGNINLGVGMIAILFVVGLIVFRMAVHYTPGAETKQK